MIKLSSVFQSKAHSAELKPYICKKKKNAYLWEKYYGQNQGFSLRWDPIFVYILYKLPV